MSACAMVMGPKPANVERDWIEYSVDAFAMPPAEQQAMREAALRAHEAEPTGESAIRLAISTASLARSADDYREASELLDFAAAAEDVPIDPSILALLRLLIDEILARQTALEQEREQRAVLQEQLDALRRLEQELNVP